MKKETFYPNIEKIVFTFSLREVIEALCSVHSIVAGKISGDVVDEEGTIEIVQIFEKETKS